MIYLHYQALQKKPFNHSRYQKRFYKSLSLHDCWRRFGYYPRFVLQDPIASAWAKLYRSEHDPSLIQARGLDFATFRHILLKFSPIYKTHTCYSEDGYICCKTSKVGQKRSLTPPAALGLVLMWSRMRGANATCTLLFGVTLPRLNMWLRFSLRVLLLILRKEPAARIQTPPPEYFELFVNLIAAQYGNLGRKRVVVAIDGVKFDVCKPGNNKKQSVFYNG